MNKSNKQVEGISHVFLPIFVVVLIGIVGTYMLVSSHASPGQYSRVNPYTSSCKGNKVKFGAPSNNRAKNEASRRRVFGAPENRSNLSPINFMGKPIPGGVHEKVKGCLQAVEWDLVNVYRTKYEVKVIYGYAPLGGENTVSRFHSYGGAVDINPQENPLCASTCAHTMPNSWVKAFRAHGFYWGGNYNSFKDYMHFEWHGQK